MKWIISNAIFSYILTALSVNKQIQSIIIMIITWFITCIIAIKISGAILYYIWYFLYFKPFKMNKVKKVLQKIEKINL